jgi:DNA (cytosine-5)-methyltransferase 1
LRQSLTIGSLFSGIGGLDLGLEWAGLGPVVWQCEIDPFCRAVLAKHWPDAKRYDDVRSIDGFTQRVDVICGGFPCQDISDAGKRAGIDGERSGLWSEYARIVGILRPRFVVVENVAALLGRGMGRVLGDLAALGYDAEWSTLRASDIGAPHRRERVFIVAYAGRLGGERRGDPRELGSAASAGVGERLQRERHRDAIGDRGASMAHGYGAASGGERFGPEGRDDVAGCYEGPLGNAARSGCEGTVSRRERAGIDAVGAADTAVAHATGPRREGAHVDGQSSGERRQAVEPERLRNAGSDGGSAQPGLGRELDGLPARVDRWPAGPGKDQYPWEAPRVISERTINRPARLRALGNAVVPQCAEVVGRRILEMVRA